MRIALLSALAEPDRADGDLHGLSALRSFAGKTVLAHQIDCAAHLGCTRILCLTGESAPEIGSLRSYARRSGLSFDTYHQLSHLAAQVTAADEIVLIADGILPDRAAVVSALSGHPAVLAFSAEQGLPLGFERIDAAHAWSGVLMARGDCAARLADLPADCNLASSLLRIVLQSGVPVRTLDRGLLADARWRRRIDTAIDPASERAWIMTQVDLAPWRAPGRALSERIGLNFALAKLNPKWRRAPPAFAGAALLGAIAAAVAGMPAWGLGCLLLAQIAIGAVAAQERVDAIGAPGRYAGRLPAIAAFMGDGVMIALLGQAVVTVPGWLGPLLAVVLTGVLNLGAMSGDRRLHGVFGDRALLLTALIPLVATGYATIAVAALLIIGLAALLWSRARPFKEITAN